MKNINNFPYQYYFYGSDDSIDTDVLISIPSDELPVVYEDRKRLLHKLNKEYSLDWNTNFIIIDNGYVINTVNPKSWIDSVNNSLYTTYHLHNQEFPLPINGLMKRNNLLAVYKCIRFILSCLSRTHYRPIIKSVINGQHSFVKKIDILKSIDFTKIETFNQNNTSDIDIWKKIAFYIGQNISLITENIEIYTKKDLIKEHPILDVFINRNNNSDKRIINFILKYYCDFILKAYIENHKQNGILLSYKDELIDMKKEIYLVK